MFSRFVRYNAPVVCIRGAHLVDEAPKQSGPSWANGPARNFTVLFEFGKFPDLLDSSDF